MTTIDASSLALDVRELDREEWVAASGVPLLVSLNRAIKHGDNWAVLDEEGRCLAIWGVNHDGNAWMIATNAAQRRLHEMHTFFKDGIARMHELHPEIDAWAYSKNHLHHKWMLRFGFKQTDQEVTTYPGCRFIRFTRSA
ncbi:hypothetical protein M2322_002692 [Rhodoblastus acidophilus]|uniref:hypothetical protein n=1 Tax=Rhodoblastus acidophilus TaxID=1074 RepID=UPI002224951C|nr:hypothetical protein [Rhodoblastus acidophilus]MCW2317138.1 hypothetical protein [Rhodoblastus acidophilus]